MFSAYITQDMRVLFGSFHEVLPNEMRLTGFVLLNLLCIKLLQI